MKRLPPSSNEFKTLYHTGDDRQFARTERLPPSSNEFEVLFHTGDDRQSAPTKKLPTSSNEFEVLFHTGDDRQSARTTELPKKLLPSPNGSLPPYKKIIVNAADKIFQHSNELPCSATTTQ